jgi:hypothetical protein
MNYTTQLLLESVVFAAISLVILQTYHASLMPLTMAELWFQLW